MTGTETSVTNFFDSTGPTTLLFGKIPINAVKRATFKDKLGVVHTLLKMVYNSITYDFTRTAEGGVVVLSSDFAVWEFIAPDDRLDLDNIVGMSLINGFRHLKNILENEPIPAWDKFAEWFGKVTAYANQLFTNCAVQVMTPDKTQAWSIDNFEFTSTNDFVDFLDTFITRFNSIKGNMKDFSTGNGVSFVLRLVNDSAESIDLEFKFRE